MADPSEEYNNKKREIGQDPLDIVQDLERERRLLLQEILRNFATWGELLSRTKELIEREKRKKFIEDTHEAEG